VESSHTRACPFSIPFTALNLKAIKLNPTATTPTKAQNQTEPQFTSQSQKAMLPPPHVSATTATATP
jgi:hypothetical protein